MPEAPEKNLALDIVRITEAAALSSARWLGRGNKEAGDGAAVDAMRNSFSTLHVDGIVVIGEGEKDHAPMLYNGEKVGIGDGPQLDVAVDPVEGTSLLAYGRPNAISTVAVAPRGSMFNPGPSYYMQKLVVAREARDVIDLDAPVDVNLHNVARALEGERVVDIAAHEKGETFEELPMERFETLSRALGTGQYKLSVEVATMTRILARMAQVPDSEVRSIQADCAREVKRLGRAPTFLQIARREQDGLTADDSTRFLADDDAEDDDLT